MRWAIETNRRLIKVIGISLPTAIAYLAILLLLLAAYFLYDGGKQVPSVDQDSDPVEVILFLDRAIND